MIKSLNYMKNMIMQHYTFHESNTSQGTRNSISSIFQPPGGASRLNQLSYLPNPNGKKIKEHTPMVCRNLENANNTNNIPLWHFRDKIFISTIAIQGNKIN